MTTRDVTVEILKHDSTGMLLAVSDDLKGLFVHGDTIEQIEERLPIAIRDIIEHETKGESHVVVQEVPRKAYPGFASKVRRFNLAEAA